MLHNHTLNTHSIHHRSNDRSNGSVYPMPTRVMPKAKSPQETPILVVDDEEALRNLLRISLQKAGYTVYTACNGAEAMDIFNQTAIDLVLLDILMPDMDGYTLCAELRKRSDIPIIMLSALNRPDDVVYGFSLGADDYISKPFQFREVEVRIQAILRRIAWLQERPDFNIMAYNDIVLDAEAHEVRVRVNWFI